MQCREPVTENEMFSITVLYVFSVQCHVYGKLRKFIMAYGIVFQYAIGMGRRAGVRNRTYGNKNKLESKFITRDMKPIQGAALASAILYRTEAIVVSNIGRSQH